MKEAPFTADRLLALYDRVAEAEDAIPRLRRFVLDLAVRGKLVEQDPTDEPAAELLKRIAKEKARLVKSGEIRKPKPFEPIDEPPFAVPANWAWSPMREVTTDRAQMIPNARFTYIDVSAINKEAGVIEAPMVLDPSDAPSRARKIVRKGDVIYSCVRPYLLNVAVVEKEIEPAPIASTAFAIINGLGLILPRYIWIVLRSPFMVAAVEETQRGQAYPAINDADFAVLPFPLPPLAEQRRIVAKVDELMALCDRLEAARAGREAVRDRLTAATLTRLTAPEIDAETFPTHARFALQTLPTLTTRPDQIKTLRQTILNLAVRGKLVAQDPTDEPAAEVLKRIAKERAARLASGRAQLMMELEAVAEHEQDFALPKEWIWTRLGTVIKLWNGFAFKSSDFKAIGIPVIRIGDLSDGEVKLSSSVHVSSDVAASVSDEVWIPEDALLLAMSGATTGKTAFNRTGKKLLLNQRVGRIECFSMNINFIRFFFETIIARNLSISLGTAIPNLSTKQIYETAIPLPPLAEQHRIVARVDALMALCDQLEASLTTAATTRSRLLEALLHEALGGAPGGQAEVAA